MKTIKPIITALIAMAVLACSKDDSPTPDSENPTNKAPNAFNLIGVTNNATGVNLLPSFSWNAAIDPDGDAIKYDLYLDDNADPTTLLAANLTEPNFTVTNKLHLITNYHWKVIAKDAKGAIKESTVNNFSTRNLNISEIPLKDYTEFSKRSGHTSLSFKGKLYVLGGMTGLVNDIIFLNDVWNSTDGKNWSRISPFPAIERIQFSPRHNHSTVVFKDKIWVIGGQGGSGALGDVWSSSNGVTWNLETNDAAFSPRYNHETLVFQDKIWVFGGHAVDNAIWSSSDGINWEQNTTSASFPSREDASSVVFDNKMWIIGGGGIDSRLNDVWYSTDGANWAQATPNAEFSPRVAQQSVIYDDKIWLFGGAGASGLLNDVWFSKDCINWSKVSDDGRFKQRLGHSVSVFDNRICLIGGQFDLNQKYNDVWVFD